MTVQSFQVEKLALQQESFEANIQDAENTLVAMKRRGFIYNNMTTLTLSEAFLNR